MKIHTFVPVPRSTQSYRLDAVSGSPSVTFVSVSSHAVPSDGCGSTTSLHLLTLDWVPLPLLEASIGNNCETRCEVVQELIFGIPVSVPTVFPESSSRKSRPPAHCRWLSPHRSVSGYSVTATAEVFVADFRLLTARSSPTTACPGLSALSLSRCALAQVVSAERTIAPEYLLLLSVSNGVDPDGLMR